MNPIRNFLDKCKECDPLDKFVNEHPEMVAPGTSYAEEYKQLSTRQAEIEKRLLELADQYDALMAKLKATK